MNTDLGPITVRLSEWHALQDANREAHDRIRELEAAVLAEREACAVLLESKATEFERIGEPKLATPCRLMASAIRARGD
jgi:hypothetical protein